MSQTTVQQGLILVDIQNDYFPDGSFELVGMNRAVNNARRLLQTFRDRQAPIFHIQHISLQPGATFFLSNTEGAKIHESVLPQAERITVLKHFPNSFRETNLLSQLQSAGISEVVICGAMSHMCIDATTRAAFDFGFDCILIEDACATRDLEYQGNLVKASDVQTAFMASLAAVYAKVISTDEFLMK